MVMNCIIKWLRDWVNVVIYTLCASRDAISYMFNHELTWYVFSNVNGNLVPDLR